MYVKTERPNIAKTILKDADAAVQQATGPHSFHPCTQSLIFVLVAGPNGRLSKFAHRMSMEYSKGKNDYDTMAAVASQV